MIPVSVRLYRDSDFPAVHRLEMEGGTEPFLPAVFIRQMGVVCRDTFLVAMLESEIVAYGIGALVQNDPGEAWILRLGVREDHRRNGVGSILLAELLAALGALGASTVRLTVSPWNMPAIGLYEKAGFMQESYHELYFGDDEDRIMMAKEIGRNAKKPPEPAGAATRPATRRRPQVIHTGKDPDPGKENRG